MSRNSPMLTRHPAANGAAADAPPADAAAAAWFARRDAGLSADEERALQHWLAADPSHGAALARLDAAWTAFGQPARTGSADELLRELAARATRRRRRLGAAAAGFVLLFALQALWRLPRPGDLAADIPATATILGPERRVLPDGSVVLLKGGAQIVEAFSATVRRVELRGGEAMFAVAKNPLRPFVVVAGDVAVRAVGTAFAVGLGGEAVDVLVTEGTVAVNLGASRAPGAAADGPGEAGTPPSAGRRFPASTVEAGQRLVAEFARPVPVLKVTPVGASELKERLAWRNRRVRFSGTPLAEVVALFNREASGSTEARLVIEDPALMAVRVSGVFQTDNVEAFVLLLEAGFGVKAERSESTITLRQSTPAPKTS